MIRTVRGLARRLLGVQRASTYYLPWLTRPGLDCALILSDVEARFNPDHRQGPFHIRAEQYAADGSLARTYEVTLADNVDAQELRLEPAAGGCGFVVVRSERVHSDLYVTLSDGEAYTATHGRGEFVETYPRVARSVMGVMGRLLATVGRTIPAFARDQYAYVGPDGRSHLLLMNLSNVVNRIHVSALSDGRPVGARLLRLPPRGSTLFDVQTLARTPPGAAAVWRLRLEGNAWFNLYLVGAGVRDLQGPLSLMHVK